MISIIIVHYHVKKELFYCLASIYTSKPKTPFEIIVVDNDEKKIIEKELKKQFPKVKYVKNDNKGFGQGNNIGATYAKGEYLFFLNPDTKLLNNGIDTLSTFFDKNKKAGIVAPILLDDKNRPYELQGIKELTPFRAIFALSFFNKLFPNNKIHQDYYLKNWDKKHTKKVDAVPGTAFVIRREIYEKLQGFDERFFLYFEEFDLCKRVRGLGWKIFMNPSAQVFHAWGSSTKQVKNDVSKIFQQSRYYYFKKHFGIIKALVTELVLRTGKHSLLLLLILAIGTFLRFSEIGNTMAFIGDQGWFYLSARDMVLSGKIPLVGIPSSHPWLHQGAFWTYLLAPVLWLFHFNPVSGAYLSAVIGIVSIWAIYKLGSVIFTKNVGLIAAMFFAVSPLVVMSDRMPYHTSPIPLFTIVTLYCLYQWVIGQTRYFPLLIAMLGVLYNFELATFLLSIIVIIILLFGFIRKKEWARAIVDKKILLQAVVGWFVVMMPMLVYDFGHGFPQTVKFMLWIGYRILVFFGYHPINSIVPTSNNDLFVYVVESYSRLTYITNVSISLVIFVISALVIGWQIVKRQKNIGYVLIAFINISLLCGLFVVKTPSYAYFPLLFPTLLLAIAVVFDKIIEDKRLLLKGTGVIVLLLVLIANSSYLIKNHYSVFGTEKDGSFKKRLDVAKEIVNQTKGKDYTIVGKVNGRELDSFMMNYEYLTWWLGHGPSKTPEKLRFVIEETQGKIIINKQEMEM